MKKKIALMVAFGCLGASAASVHYDILGRKGSKMNSPMVYRNMDYSKTNNDHQKLGSSSISRVLKKDAVGLHNNAVALEGRYNSRGWDRNYYFIRADFPVYGDHDGMPFSDLREREGYGGKAWKYFFNNNYSDPYSHLPQNPSPQSFAGTNGYYIGWQNINLYNNIAHQAAYEPGQLNLYKAISHVRDDEGLLDKSSFNEAYGDINAYNAEWGDVGVYINSYARPGYMNRQDYIKYYVDPTSGSFQDMPGHEFRTSQQYKILRTISSRSIVYSTTKNPQDPSVVMSGRPTPIYIGLRTNVNAQGTESTSIKYGDRGKSLDNYIYDNRTIEIVAAGNSKGSKNFHLNAQAANAITVGAVDPNTKQAVRYMPNIVPKYCPQALKPCSNNNGLVTGTHKPEVYNYTHFYTNDQRTDYTKNGKTTSFEPFYDGTESAAAVTAAMVSDLLVTNSFYRWHPEVVKALLMTSAEASGGLVPTYPSMMPKRGSQNGIAHESRYWIGDFDHLRKILNTGKNEIWFSVPRPSNTSRYVAAISWLSRGDDIERLGKIPQNFDIRAYATNFDIREKYPEYPRGWENPVNIENPGTFLNKSESTVNTYEKMSFTATSDYITFCITLVSDESSADYRGQIALGFDMASY